MSADNRAHTTSSDPKTPKKKGCLSRIVKSLVILVVILVVLLVSVRLYLSDSRLRGMVKEKMSDAFGRDVEIGELHLALLDSIQIKQLSVKDKPQYGGNMMTLENLRVAYKPFSILGDSIEIPEITVEGLQLRVVKKPDGTLNVTDLPTAPPSPPPKPKTEKPSEPLSIPNFRVGKITVSNVGLDYADQAANRTLSLSGLGLDGTCSASENVLDLDLSVGLEKIVSQVSDKAPTTSPPVHAALNLKLDAGQNAFEITKAEVKGEGVDASVAGKGSFAPEKTRMDLQGTVAIDLSGATLTALSGLEGQKGTINVELDSSGVPPALKATIKIQGNDLAWPVDTGGEQPDFFQLASLAAEQELSGREDETLSLSGNVAVRNIGITGRPETIDAMNVSYNLEADVAKQSAHLRSLAVKGPGLIVGASGKVGAEHDGARPVDLEAAVEIDLARAVEPLVPSVKNCQGNLKLSAKAEGSTLVPILDLALSAPSLQLTQVETGTTYRIEGLEATEKSSLAEDQIHLPVKGSLRVARFDMIPAAGEPVSCQNLAVTNSMVLDASRYDLEIDSIEVALPGLSATSSGWIKDGLSENPRIDISKQVTMNFAEILPWALPAQAGMLEGVLRVDASVTGSKNSAAARIQARSDRLAYALEQDHFRETSLAADIKMVLDASRYDLEIESIDVSLAGLSAAGSGWIKDGLSDDPRIEITKQVTMNFGELLPWAVPAQAGMLEGVLQVDASVSGSKKSPEVSIQAKSERLAYRAEESGVPLQLETSLDANLNLSGNVEQNIQVAADVKGLPRFVDSTGKEIDKADLTAVLRAGFSVPENRLELETASVNAFGLNTSAKGTVEAAGETPVVNANADGELDFGGIAPLLRAAMGLSRDECDAAGKAAFSIALAGDANNQRAEVKATADRLELKYSPEEGEQEEAEEEPAPEQEKEGPVPQAMDLTGKSALVTAKVNSLTLNGIPIRNAVLEAQSDGNKLQLKRLSGDVAGGNLNLSATADTGVPGWDYNISGGVQHVGLASLISLAAPDKADTADGRLGIDLGLAGRGFDMPSLSKNLRGQGQVSMATLEVTPANPFISGLQALGAKTFRNTVRFDAFQSQFTIQDGAIQPRNLRLKSSDVAAEFLGEILLDGTFRNASLTLQFKEGTLMGIKGLDELSVPLKGTVGQPEFALEGVVKEGVTTIIEKEVGEEVGDTIKGLFDIFKRKKD
jgi:uncharacterized protein involved in outer membrane biogenesis